jgi:hypothetical protein
VVVRVMERQLRAGFGADPANEALVRSFLTEAPLRTLLMGGVGEEQLATLLDLLNGRWVTGGERLLRSLREGIRRR